MKKDKKENNVNFILNNFKDKTLVISTHNPKIQKICNKSYEIKDHKLSELL